MMEEDKKYYLLKDGNKTGPFGFEELKTKPLSVDMLVWYKGLREWLEIKEIPELNELLKNVPPDRPQMPETYLLQSILVTIFCCLPLGVVAIMKSLKISEYYNRGQYAEAKKQSKETVMYLELGTIIGIFIIALILIVYFSILFIMYPIF